MKKLLLLLAAVTLSTGMIACNNKKSTNKTSRVARGYNQAGHPGGTTGPITTPDGRLAGWDALFNSPNTTLRGNNIKEESYNLLSVNVPREQIGQLTGDVVMAMNIRIVGNGQVDTQNTRIGMVFWDDYALGGAEPLTILMDPVVNTRVSGQIQGNQIQVVFEDEYGKIFVSGVISGNQFNGSIGYQNLGAGTRTLGSFTLPLQGTLQY